MERKALSKRIRFEVLKRDLFRCRYCGKTAEESDLHVDHIRPVSLGGENDLMNLVTSCEPCNLGKSNIPLSDNEASLQARKQAEKLHDKKEILEMMAMWRDGLRDIEGDKFELLVDYWEEYTPGYSISETFYQELRKEIRKFSYEEVCEAMDDCASQYLKHDSEGNLTRDSIGAALRKLGPVLYWKKKIKDEPHLNDLLLVRSIAKKKCDYFKDQEALAMLTSAFLKGVPVNDLKIAASRSRCWSMFRQNIESLEIAIDQ